MRDPSGKFIGYGKGDASPECQRVNHRLLFAYNGTSHAKELGVLDGPLFTQATETALTSLTTFMNGDKTSQFAAGTRGAKFPLRIDGVADLNVRKAIGAYVPPPPPGPVCVAFSINGAGSTWNMGYPFDIGEMLDKSRCFHQPIGYDTRATPMMKHVLNSGVPEFINQLDMPRANFGGRSCADQPDGSPGIPWLGIFYSMGALVGMTVLMRILYGDLGRFKQSYMGSSAFGNPMRQHGHVFPGGIPVDGEGIVTPNAHDCPDVHWDFVSSKGMVGSQGDDLYAKVGAADQFLESNPLTVSDMRAVWDIVSTTNPLHLAEAIINLVATPSFSEVTGAFGAAWNAAMFFIAKGVSPHTTYQFVQTRAGDPRSAWDHALWHSADMVARLPMPFVTKRVAA